jgi:hypothetical protein
VNHGPHFRLHRGQAWWELAFEGRTAILRDVRGLHYAAVLLSRPNAEPLHALRLLALVRDAESARELPAQRSLALDNWETARALQNRLRLLEQVIHDDQANAAERREAEAEHHVLLREREQWHPPLRDNATRAVDAVRKALERLVRSLERAQDAKGQEHHVLHAFGAHLRRHLMRPSGRGWGARSKAAYPPGAFCYEPPGGVSWEIK